MNSEHLINGRFYHIYNRGNNRRNLFSEAADYEHFLSLYEKYVIPVADTFAWVLMPNHFHLLIQTRENIFYKYSEKDRQKNGDIWFAEHKWETAKTRGSSDNKRFKEPLAHRHFAHLFNAYARFYNKKTGGAGNLFERPFKRKAVDNNRYLKKLIIYIHSNPVHHGFCSHPVEYPWSGYLSCICDKQTKINREAVLNLFGNKDNFSRAHHLNADNAEIEKWLNLNTTDYVTETNKDETGIINANMSGDDVGLKENKRIRNLSAFEEPDNVKRENSKTKKYDLN